MRVGITFFLRSKPTSIWDNGAFQNAVFLWMLLKLIPGVDVVAINGGDGDAPHPGLMLGSVGLGIEFHKISDELVDTLDVLIECAAQVSAAHVKRVHARGGKAITYKFGNAFVIDAERVIHGKESGSIFNGAQFDEVWTNPQHVPTCASYWETCYRAPVRVLPHIWEPLFLDVAAKELADIGLSWGYKRRVGAQKARIAVIEPNINIVKTSTIPMLVIERAFRQPHGPELIGEVYVTNAERLKSHETFASFANNLDVVRARHPSGGSITSFEGRLKTPFLMAKYADVVVCHQIENALNYAYYDLLHGGYPLIHNSDLLPRSVGYYYQGFDTEWGASALTAALLTHDSGLEDYRARSNAFLATVRATSPANVQQHEQALERLMRQERAAA